MFSCFFELIKQMSRFLLILGSGHIPLGRRILSPTRVLHNHRFFNKVTKLNNNYLPTSWITYKNASFFSPPVRLCHSHGRFNPSRRRCRVGNGARGRRSWGVRRWSRRQAMAWTLAGSSWRRGRGHRTTRASPVRTSAWLLHLLSRSAV
jgi:hypothetical protein